MRSDLEDRLRVQLEVVVNILVLEWITFNRIQVLATVRTCETEQEGFVFVGQRYVGNRIRLLQEGQIAVSIAIAQREVR